MLCGSWLRETTLGFKFFFSSLRLLDISYFCLFPTSTWLDWMMYDAPSNTYCIQVKPVGRREVKNESQGEERNSSWKFVLRSVNALWRHVSLKALRDNCNRLCMYKIWLEGSNDPASLQLLFVSKFIGPIYCQSNYCSKLIIHSFACGRDSNFVWAPYLHSCHWVPFCLYFLRGCLT